MAHRGPAPKPSRHGHSPTADWTEVPDVPYSGPSPELPRLPRRAKWNDLVVHWWEQVRHMPHCSLWGPTDWAFAVETALMKHWFWTAFADGVLQSTTATEIRRREDQLGTTKEALRKLRIRYVAPQESTDDVPVAPAEVSGTVTSLDSRRSRLTA